MDARFAKYDGTTLLIGAAVGEHDALVQMLVQRGASVNLQNSFGLNALIGAANYGHTTTVQALLDAKADASLQNVHGDGAGCG